MPGPSAKPERSPPFSEEAERGVLGSVLLDAERVLDLAVERGLRPESFYLPAHRVLFEVMLAMARENRPVDLLTVTDRLQALGRLEEIGGASFLERLVDSTPTAAHAEYYIDLVRQKHLLRMIIDRARAAQELSYEAVEDADTVLGKVEESFFAISDIQRVRIEPWPDLIRQAVEEIERICTLKKGISGIPTGFIDLDRILLGLHPTDMIVLAARPSMGKTALALNIVENVALGLGGDHQPRPVGIFSLEMSREQLVRRMICSHARVPGHKLAGGFISTDQHRQLMNAAAVLSKAQIYLDDTAGLEVLELRSRARRMRKRFGVELIVVDYLQLLNYPQFANEGRQRETAAISGALKAMAKELNVPVLVLSQLSRAPEQRDKASAIPRLSDLRDSGSIEQDADVVMLLRRPSLYPEDPEHEDETLAIVNVAKHRNGPIGEVRLNFEAQYTRFENRLHGTDTASFVAAEGSGEA